MKFKIIKGNGKGEMISLKLGKQRLGRSKENEVCVDDKKVSSFHAEINIDKDGNVGFIDLNSRNGSFVNGNQVTTGERISLSDGDRIILGSTVLELVGEDK